MKRLFWITIIITVLAAFFASANPDGLDFVSEKLGFAEKGQSRTAPMPDYSVPFLSEGGLSTAMAGIAGVLITLSVFWLVAFIIKKGNNGMKKTLAFLFAVSILLSSTAFAARPLVTDDFGTVDPGKYELELGYNSSAPKTGGASTTGISAQLKRGITSNFDLGIEAQFSYIPHACLGDLILHAKLKIIESGENDGLTGRVNIKLCNADSLAGIGSGYYDYTATAIYSKEIAGFRTHYNLGYTIVGVPAGSPSANTVNYSAAIEKQVRPGIDIVSEYFAVSSPTGATGNLQIGGKWQANEMFRLDAGYSLALNDSSLNVITAGLTTEF